MSEISIIVPVYRAERYLHACIDSILGQTFSDFELILVDDGSPDNCAAICEDYAARDSRIVFLRQENQGQSAARNHALEIARGKWICFVDSDDLIHPEMVALLYEAVRKGAGISMCRMLEAPELPAGFRESRETEFAYLTMDEETLVRLFDEGRYPAWVACAKLIPKAVIEAYPFRPGRVYEDNEAVCRWVCQAGSLAMTDRELYYYRTNPASTTQSAFSRKKLDYLWALESILRFYHGMGWKTMAERFTTSYVRAAADFCRVMDGVPEYEDALKNMRRNVRTLFGKERLPLTKAQLEELLDGFHHGWMKVYWPLEAVYRRLTGLLQKGGKP